MKKIDISSVINSEINCYLQTIHQVTPWDFANELLYTLCRQYPHHDDEEIILSKTLIIGRVYAATLERNAIKNKQTAFEKISFQNDSSLGDDFYLQKVVPLFKSFFNRNDIKELILNITQRYSRPPAVELQGKFETELRKLQRGGKTSFSSKYLHFHFPHQFFIYDSRANKALPYLKEEGEQEKEDLTYNRQDFCATTSNKQLNFVQHIRSMLKTTGKAAVVVSDQCIVRVRRRRDNV